MWNVSDQKMDCVAMQGKNGRAGQRWRKSDDDDTDCGFPLSKSGTQRFTTQPYDAFMLFPLSAVDKLCM